MVSSPRRSRRRSEFVVLNLDDETGLLIIYRYCHTSSAIVHVVSTEGTAGARSGCCKG